MISRYLVLLAFTIAASDDCHEESYKLLKESLDVFPKQAIAAGFVGNGSEKLHNQLKDFFGDKPSCGHSEILEIFAETLYKLRDNLIKYALSENWATTVRLEEANEMGVSYFRLFELILESGKEWLSETDLRAHLALAVRLQLHPIVISLLQKLELDMKTLSQILTTAVINHDLVAFDIISTSPQRNAIRDALLLRLGRYSPAELAALQCHNPPKSCSMQQKVETFGLNLETSLRINLFQQSSDSASLPEFSTTADDGGWRKNYKEFPNDCSVVEVSASELTPERFLSDFSELSFPFIMRGAGNKWPLKKTLSRNVLFTKHGNLDLLVGYIPYADVFGEFNGFATIDEYIQYMDRLASGNESDNVPLYVFDDHILTKEHFKNQYTLPDAFKLWQRKEEYHQFILGAPGSGAPFHFHCPAANIVMYGRKRWFLYPPGLSRYSKVHPLHWYSNVYEKEKQSLVECTQLPGDLLFVPSRWTHSVLNIDEVVGIAVEFDC